MIPLFHRVLSIDEGFVTIDPTFAATTFVAVAMRWVMVVVVADVVFF
jgi:hypothetical protein